MSERVRFSPSPSGDLHLGGARTALFNALTALRSGGVFVLRFEDTDQARCVAGSEERIVEGLRWLGLSWAEGPDVGGPHGPYRQSERRAFYAAAIECLSAQVAVYPCFCSPGRLAEDRATDAADHRAPRYPGRCRSLSREQAAARIAAGEPHAWRFAVPLSRDVIVRDLVHGDVRFETSAISDFVVARSDGSPLYDLACAVDDGSMRITTVIRGDDHLPNTPRQILLHEALGSACPRWAHVPLVVDAAGAPLSKSTGSTGVLQLRDEGHLPAAVVNHIALLGWSDPEGREVLTLDELAAVFDVSRVSPSPARHDPGRLVRLDRLHWRRMSDEERIAAARPFLPHGLDPEDVPRVLRAVEEEIDTPGSLRGLLAGVWEPRASSDRAPCAALEDPAARLALTTAIAALGDPSPFADALKAALREAGLSPRDAMPAIRAALVGTEHGLRVDILVDLMGAPEARSRLEASCASIDIGAGGCG